MAQSAGPSGNFMPANFRVRGHLAMEYFTRSLLIILSVVFGVTGDTVHLTMVTPTPYGAGYSQSSASISCFRSSPDSSTTLSFGRPFPIGLPRSTIQTSITLPNGNTESSNGRVVTQYLTTSNDATGLFYCQGSNRQLTTRVYSIIHSVNRRFEPVDGLVTKTINKGEDVTLSVITVNSGGSPLWHRIRNGTVTSNFPDYNQASFTLPSTDAVDGDLYAVIGSAVTLADNHFSMIRLIVRGCVEGKWGPPDCVGECDMCYNGGVCDDETGDCICPPGFSGPNCLTACGMHRYGWSCEFQCGPGNVIQSCTGSQFGLPDPYGNSCTSGYKGTYCNISCPIGTFGAGCTQICRCQVSDASCDRFTGACTPSGCQAGWSGTSCQISGTCTTGKFGLDCSDDCHCSNNAACERDSGYCSGSNGVCADGFKSDMNANNCQTGIIEFQMLTMPNQGQDVTFSCAATSGDALMASSIVLATSGSVGFTRTETSTEGKVLNNTFTASVLVDNQLVTCYLFHSSEPVSTTLRVSLFVPPYLSQAPEVVAGPGSVNVSWQAWGSHADDSGDGPIIRYIVYNMLSPGTWTMAGEIPVTDQSQAAYSFLVQPLEPSTQYQFIVAAVRDGPGGQGPWSPASQLVYPLTTPPPTTPPPTTPPPTPPSPTTEGPTMVESTTILPPSITTLPAITAPVVTESSSPKASITVASGSTPPPPPTGMNDNIVTIVVVAVLAILVIVVLILVALLVRHYRRRRSKEVSVDGLQGKFGSSDHLSSLEAIDNPVSIPLEDVNSNGDVSPEPTATTTTPTPTDKARPKSGTSLISMLDSSSAFAGLPLYPPPERELKKDPIPLKEFVAYMRRAMQGPQLREEWSSFPGIEAICSCDVSQLPDNKPKNRYRNIPAYDHCRVILDHGEDDENLGYINAGYIKGYKNDKAYIATQGPTQATSHDFWKMVWQENVRIIVNGTNLVEDGKNKCHKYWPDVGKSETLGGILISALSEESKGEYTVRSMTIGKVGDKESSPRKIIQFHYTTWPDKDVPKDVTPVLKFVKEFSEATPKDTGPYLIHCSAGVGRTGVIIGIHASLQRARAEKTLDVYNFVADMRDHRVSSVQTPVQYTFIHLALLEALFSDDTTVPAASLGKRVTELKKKKKLAEEFEQLNTITPTPSRERCRNSMANTNQSKNRFPRTLALEGCRPFLMTPREDGMEYNYINASFVDGFQQRDFAVVTQAPLPNTVLDLWRLVYDYQISSIIMLNAPDPDDTSCPQYWPDQGSEEYGPFTVTTTNTADLEGYRIKQMKLEHRRQKRSHSFKHYQVTDWPLGQEVPKSPSALLRLIQTVDKHKPKDKRSASLVHCIDGLNRSGVFCVLKNSLDRLHEEDVVDILQTTKVLRLNRPNLLNSLDMYRFCYEAMLAYVNNPEEFKAEAIPEPVYENTPRDMEKDKPKESIYQNLEPKSSETPET